MAAIPTTDSKGNEIANHEERVEAANWAIETLRTLGREDLIDHLTIDWSSKFTSRLGDACYINVASLPPWRKLPKKYNKVNIDGIVARVRFSAPIWPRATESERYQTVVHEVCHLVTSHEAHLDNRPRPEPHGWEWKRTMRRAGVRPDRCHNVNTKGLKGKKASRRTEVAHCNCRDHAVTPAMARKIGKGHLYICRDCKAYLVLGSKDSHLPRAKTPDGYTVPTPSAMGW